MTAYGIADALYALKDQGATVDRDGIANPYDTGYYVGGLYPSLVFDSVHTMDRGEVAWWIGNHPANLYGVWEDDETGKVYVDAVQWDVSRRAAVQVGRDRGELAVWDIKNSREIRCDDPEGPAQWELNEISEP